jgi:DNA-binding winged helix-turn-helix (wHTH) protein
VPVRVTFGEFALDLDSRQLLGRSGEIHLLPKAFELLKALVESRPKAVGKRELQERLWPGTFVVEANLAILISGLRAALGDSPRRPRFIRTVHGFGYAFTGDAVEISDLPPGEATTSVCWVVWHRRQFRLVHGENLIGRDPLAPVSVDLPSVSRRHARIVVTSSGATLEDLGSKNGTHLRGKRVTGTSGLLDGDKIQVGSVILTFRTRPIGGSTETQVATSANRVRK